MIDTILLGFAFVAMWFIVGTMISFIYIFSPLFTHFKRKVLATFVCFALLLGGLFVVGGLVTDNKLVGFTIGGMFVAQSILAYALSYYKVDNPDKYQSPNGYFHILSVFGIPTAYLKDED